MRFDGTVPWYTGWGLNDVMLLAGVTEADEVVFAFADAREQPGLRPSPPLRLAALTAARTVSLELDGLRVPAENVVRRTPRAEFARVDVPRSTNASPAVFGVARAALDLLGDTPDERGAAESLRAGLDEVRARAYALADHPVAHEHVEERLALRTRAYDLMRAATTAAVVAGGGGRRASTAPLSGSPGRRCSCWCRGRRRRCAGRTWRHCPASDADRPRRHREGFTCPPGPERPPGRRPS